MQKLRLPRLGNREFYRAIITIGVPIALQNLLTSSLSLVDSLMVGSLGEQSLAAVGAAGQFTQLLFGFYWGLCCGGTMFFAQYWGVRDHHGIRRAYGVTCVSMMFVALCFTVAGLFFPERVMGMYTPEPAVQQLGVKYIRLVAVSYLFQTFSMAHSCLLRSVEQVKLPLFASIVSIATNTFFNWLLIYGNLGFPCMGVEGAAIASVLASIVNVGVLMGVSLYQRNISVTGFRQMFAFKLGFVKEYFAKSLPIILNEVLYGLALLVVNIVVGRQGEGNMAAMSLFRTIEGLVFAFFRGLSSACSVTVGMRAGAGRFKEAMQYGKWFTAVSAMLTFCACAMVVLLRGPILSPFNITDAVRAMVMNMLMIYMFTAPLRTCNYIMVNTYRSGGESRMGMYFEVGGMWLITAPLTALAGLVWHLPFIWVFLATFVEEVIKLPIELRYLFSARWIKPVTPEGRAALAQWKNSGVMPD